MCVKESGNNPALIARSAAVTARRQGGNISDILNSILILCRRLLITFLFVCYLHPWVFRFEQTPSVTDTSSLFTILIRLTCIEILVQVYFEVNVNEYFF